MEIRLVGFCVTEKEDHPMSETGVRGIDLFKIAGASISGWIPSWKTGDTRPTRQPFCSQMEEQLLLWLEYHPLVAWYGRGDISATFASTYKLASPLPIPFTINYLFESKAHVYLPDAIGQLLDGRLFIAEAGLEQDKRRERNRAKAEAARKVAEQQAGAYWIGTEATLSKTRHANLVFLHARRQTFPTWSQLEEALQVIWPWGEAACVQELVERLGERWPQAEREAAIWKRCAESAARGHLLVDLASVSLTRLTPLICLSPDAPPILPDPLPSDALSIPAPAQLAQVDEHSMELYVITPDGIPVTRRVHAAVLICVKTAAIMSAVLALGPLKEEDYMRLVKMALEPKDRLVLQAGCQHSWPCSGKPAIVFHDRGKIFTSERARQVLVDRLGIITEQAPP
jgi:hypothetical protein